MSDITVLHRSESPIVGSKAPRLRVDAHTARCGISTLEERSGVNVRRALAAFFGLALGGCSLLLDTSAQQCSTDNDCRARGGQFTNATCSNHVCISRSTTSTTTTGGGGGGDAGDPDTGPVDPVWGCLGHVMMETPQGTTANVGLPFFDLIRMVPITDVGVLICPKLDVTCSRPISNGIAAADSQGVAHFTVPQFFDGYGVVYDLAPRDGGTSDDDGGSDGGDGGSNPSGRFIPSVVFFNPPIVNDTTFGIVPLFTKNDIVMLAAVQGNTWDPGLGILFAGMLDCSRKPAAGVTWDPSIVDMKSKRFFYINGFPDEAANATDATGFSGLLNAPTGTITVNAKVQSTGKRVGSATVLVRPGSASYTYLAPTP
jgi:hypothetical protein